LRLRIVALVGMIAVLLFQPLFFHYSVCSDISFNLYRIVRAARTNPMFIEVTRKTNAENHKTGKKEIKQ